MSKGAPLSLFKYVKAKEGIKILSEHAAPWLAPHHFSDPFEYSHQTSLGFDAKRLESGFMKVIAAMIFASDPPPVQGNPIKRAVVRWRQEDRFHSEEEVEVALKGLVSGMVEQSFEQVMEEYNEWRHFSENIRVFCVSDNIDNALNWDLFAEQHRGFVIKFRCGSERMLNDPRQVSYRASRPPIASIKEEISIMLGDRARAKGKDLLQHLLVKSKQQSKEKEWRCFRTLPVDDIEATSIANNEKSPATTTNEHIADDLSLKVSFAPEEVVGIYLGASMSDEDEKSLLTICKKNYPKAAIFKAEPKLDQFELSFDRIS